MSADLFTKYHYITINIDEKKLSINSQTYNVCDVVLDVRIGGQSFVCLFSFSGR